MSACVEPNQLVAFASGQLSGPALEDVESHLDTCPSCRTALAAVARLDSNDTTLPSSTLTPLRTGTLVGRYEVQSVAGAGGMGIIYRATDPTLHRTVALKLVRPGRLSSENAERLLFEAKAMARVVHPEVLPVFDAGTFGDEVFIAMEWVEGRTLRAELGARVHGWREVVHLFIRAGRGLAAAHRAGLVHRDFKPENVLIGDDGRLRVSDFGLAHDLAASAVAAGTPAFMAPELLRGEAATPASDQFAFCVALRDALQGARPRALDTLLQRGLEPEASARHASMDALVEALEQTVRPSGKVWLVAVPVALLAVGGALVRSNEPRCTGGVSTLSPIWNQARKDALLGHAAGTADAARAARVAAVLDVFAARWSAAHRQVCEATRVRGEQSEALMDLKLACLEQRLAAVDAVLGELERNPKTAFSKSVEAAQDAVTLGRCSDLTPFEGRSATPLSAETRTKVATLRKALAALRPLTVMGPFEQGKEQAQTLLAEAKTLGVKSVESDAHLRVAEFLRKLRATKGATAALDAELEEAILAGTEAQDAHGTGEAWLLRMRTCTDDGRFEEAERAERALTANLRAVGNDVWLQARHDLSHASLLMRQSKLDEARAAWAAAEALLAKLPEEERRLLSGDVHAGAALVEVMAGNLERGAHGFERAIAENEARFGADHPSLADIHHNLAETELNRDRLASAEKHVDEAGRIWTAVFGSENPRVAVNLTLRVAIRNAARKHDEALADVAEAKRILTGSGLETSFMFMRVLCAEGEVHLARNEVARSEEVLRAGLALASGAVGKYPTDEANCHLGLAETLAGAKKDEARAEYQRAIALFEAARSSGRWLQRARDGLTKLDAATGPAPHRQ